MWRWLRRITGIRRDISQHTIPAKMGVGVGCDVSAMWGYVGFGVAAAAEEGWADEKQAVLNDGEMRIIWSDPPGTFILRNLLTGFKECMLDCVVGYSTTRQSSVKSLESGWRRISEAVRPAVTVVVQRLLAILLDFLQPFTDSFWLVPDVFSSLAVAQSVFFKAKSCPTLCHGFFFSLFFSFPNDQTDL